MIQVSVVVPTFKRPDLLDLCLSALLRQDFPRERYEIIIADDAFEREEVRMSAATRKRVEEMGREAGIRVTYVPVSGEHGPSAARNQGWRRAQGTIIAFTDDDTIPDREWLTIGCAAFTDEVLAVAGRTVVPLPENPTDYELNESGLSRAEFITANCFVRKNALSIVGGFDERFAMAWREDSDLHFRLLKLGGGERAVKREPRALVVHPVRPAGFAVCIKQARKVAYNALLYKKHPKLYRERIQKHPPLRYYAMIALLLFSFVFAGSGHAESAQVCFFGWLVLVLEFTWLRLKRTTRRPLHVIEMFLTSALLAPLAIYWRLHGAIKFRVAFL